MQDSTNQLSVYDTLVNNDSDFIGMIAYSIYKGEKIEIYKSPSNDRYKQIEIEKLKSLAIQKPQIYIERAEKVAEVFAEGYIVDTIVNENYAATLMAENRKKAINWHIGLSIVWGIGIVIFFGVLGWYLNYTKDSTIYHLGNSFKSNNEILLYLLERFSRRVFIIGAIFLGIRILWTNFKMSFNGFVTNMHYADNLRIFDYVKNECKEDQKDSLIKETLMYVFLGNHVSDKNDKISFEKAVLKLIDDKLTTVLGKKE